MNLILKGFYAVYIFLPAFFIERRGFINEILPDDYQGFSELP